VIKFWQLPHFIQEDKLPDPFSILLKDTTHSVANRKFKEPKDRIKEALKYVRKAIVLLKEAIAQATKEERLEEIPILEDALFYGLLTGDLKDDMKYTLDQWAKKNGLEIKDYD